jgi:LuxR family maltose regulon positive regulatory protein
VAEVAASLLATKLFVPPAQPGLVARPRLQERFRVALNYGLVLVSAPAGFGKTTLVSEWVHSSRPPVPTAWLSLEEGENDPVRFWDYFVAALKIVKPAVGETALFLLHAPEPYPTESLLTALINDLTGIRKDFLVVLDDYHLIVAEPIHAGIAFLLDHLPPKMHLIISTRVDPPLPLAHFRGKGTLLEIGADDLRFSQEETTSLFAAMDTPPLSAESINALNTKAEGWVVGLKMAALSMRREKDILAFIAGFTGSQRYIMDYLVDEVLQRQPDEVRDFLLKTSVLERLSAPLCDYVTGHGGGREMLVRLEQANMFIVALDESRQWYRYHHLFAEFLRHQLEVMSRAEEVMALHQRASQWCDDHEFPDEAVRYALAYRDWETAMRLIYAQSGERLKRGEWNTLIDWLQVIPDELLRTHPRLYSQYARALVEAGQFKPGEAALSYLERTAQADASLQGEVAFSQNTLARRRGDIPLAIEMAEKALSLLPPDSFAMRAWTSFWLGFVQYARGLLEEARRLFSDAYEMGRQAGEYWVGAQGAAWLGVILWMRGRLREALEMAQQAVDLAGQLPVAAALPQSILATLLYYWNDLEGSARSAQLSVEFSELGGVPMVLLDSCFWLARARLAQGDVAGAMAAMENMDQAARLPGVDRAFRAYHAAWHVMFAIWQDDLASALDWGSRLQEYADVLPFDACYVPARLLIARGEKTLAAEQLQGLCEKAIQADAQGFVIWLRVYQALAAATPAEALTFLAEALSLGQPEGFIRFFVDEGRLLAPLLRTALSQGITPEYTSKLLSIIEAEEQHRKSRTIEVTPSALLPEPLSGRELEVLRLLAADVSNQQIASRLTISLSTVKTHVHHILEKLDVKDRSQAVFRARELKLL